MWGCFVTGQTGPAAYTAEVINIPAYCDLFEDLRKKVECMYISDMRFSPYNGIARHEFSRMDLSKYPAEMLLDAVQYLYGESEYSSEDLAKLNAIFKAKDHS